MLQLSDVLEGVGSYSLPYGWRSNISFTDIIHDSRLASPGALFVALRAERDGHEFIIDAYHRGAAGVLSERFIDIRGQIADYPDRTFAYIIVDDTLAALQRLSGYWRSKHDVEVIAVTGSVGKTTTKEMIAAVLEQRFTVLKTEKNFNNEIGLPITLLRLGPEHKKAVLEMGMYAVGEIDLLCRLARPRIGVITNVGPTHLERLRRIEHVAQAKAELVAALPADGYAILNGDDPLVRQMARYTSAKPFLFGLNDDCDFRATSLNSRGLDGIDFRLAFGSERIAITTSLIGRHNVYTCLAAIAVARIEGLTWPEILQALASTPVSLRLTVIPGTNGSVIIDDTYNASPASTLAALGLLAETGGRKIAILGDMLELGDYEEEGHRLVGRRAAQVADMLIVVGDRARWIGEEAKSQGLATVQFYRSNQDVSLDLRAGDHVLVKGSRGMRMEEIVTKFKRKDDHLNLQYGGPP
ncbi:MAG: UDP-N-acetylmuramoyl-tripeptide--D-alanyl-D-alanine ligase [Chloroflexi bacterium]|nr:UDP-N-acetylmuramoyl-tripeptide--D-alanyl-D-alanine ligase [Chloroflexota bacterium]MCL5075653.1 UDP-N-acetylmuramoyl-tripeptide--D-alanyl-D-alanine ligase [Chloroflexota bacterium]